DAVNKPEVIFRERGTNSIPSTSIGNRSDVADDAGQGDKMSKNNTASLLPFMQGRYIENSRWYMGSVMTFLVNSEHTNGSFSITEYLSKPGNEPPAHVHPREE